MKNKEMLPTDELQLSRGNIGLETGKLRRTVLKGTVKMKEQKQPRRN
jgi:hypothetical protein